MIRKPTFIAVTAAILLSVRPSTLSAAKVIDRIIARVNNEIVTQRQFEREKEKVRAELAQRYSGPELDTQVRGESKNLLRDLIDESLMVQKAKDLDINVETDLVKRLDEIRQNLKLATIQDLEKEVETQGLIWEDFQDNIRRKLLMREVIGKEVGSRVTVSREDARKFFQAHQKEFSSPGGMHLAEILISADKHKPREVEQRAKDALAEIKAGQRWAEVAKKYSDADTAKEGGDIGFFKEGTLAPAIAEVVNKVDVGDTTGLIKTKDGQIIIKVLERLSAGVPKFEEIEQRVDEAMYNEKMQPALRQYLATLRKESYIFLAPGYVDTGAERAGELQLAQTQGE
jgi:peptidyl-prolyl cis-trans isomerase SurA